MVATDLSAICNTTCLLKKIIGVNFIQVNFRCQRMLSWFYINVTMA